MYLRASSTVGALCRSAYTDSVPRAAPRSPGGDILKSMNCLADGALPYVSRFCACCSTPPNDSTVDATALDR